MIDLHRHSLPAIGDGVPDMETALAMARIGVDARPAPDLAEGMKNGRVPSLHSSRYFLYEPPHNVVPPQLAAYCFELLDRGHTPLITHPERLSPVLQILKSLK